MSKRGKKSTKGGAAKSTSSARSLFPTTACPVLSTTGNPLFSGSSLLSASASTTTARTPTITSVGRTAPTSTITSVSPVPSFTFGSGFGDTPGPKDTSQFNLSKLMDTTYDSFTDLVKDTGILIDEPVVKPYIIVTTTSVPVLNIPSSKSVISTGSKTFVSKASVKLRPTSPVSEQAAKSFFQPQKLESNSDTDEDIDEALNLSQKGGTSEIPSFHIGGYTSENK